MIPTKRKIMPHTLLHIGDAINISQQGIDLIADYEKCVLEAYLDSAGIWTIGYGSTRYENGFPVKEGDKITLERAKQLFAFHLSKFTGIVLNKIKRPLLQNELDALVSFCFNAGTSYKSGSQWRDYQIWAKVNNRTITKEYWKTLAITAGGKKLKGLIRRRKSEAKLYFDGILSFS